MGMWQTSKEVSAATLARLLDRPWDAAHVDGILFDSEGAWSAEATRTTITDDDLRSRFTYAAIPRTLDEMRTLDEIGGDFDSSLEDVPWIAHLAATGVTGRADDLAVLLRATSDAGAYAEIPSRFSAEATVMPAESWTTPDGELRFGFASNVPCYGINSFSRPAALAARWAGVRTALDVHAAQRTAIMSAFGRDIIYTYGCAMRGSAELWVIW